LGHNSTGGDRSLAAQSEIIGVVLILGITFTGISIIWVTGSPSLESTKDLSRSLSAENSISLLDERVSSAALSGAGHKKVTLNLGSGDLSVSPTEGTIRVYSAPSLRVLPKNPSPSEDNVNHVLNFTVESGSSLNGVTLDNVTVRYPPGFDTGGVNNNDDAGIDTDIDGTAEKTVGYDADGTGPNSRTVEVDFVDDETVNETDLVTVEIEDVDNPSSAGDYEVEAVVSGESGDSVTKKTGVEITEDPPRTARQIDTTIEMGKIEYESEDSVVAYQNGGVWKKEKGETDYSKRVSKPELYYQQNTLTGSIINVTNTATISLSGTPSLTVENAGNERIFPKTGTERTNPLGDENVYVEVNTSYHEAWSDYFESETVGDVVEVEGTGNRRAVRVELSPLPDAVFNQAVVAQDGDLNVTNTTVDSYDSTVSEYSPQLRFSNADIAANGNVSIRNGSSPVETRVYGGVLSGGRVTVEPETGVRGGVKAYGSASAPGGENITADGSPCPVGGDLVAPGVIGAPNCPLSQKDNRIPDENLPSRDLVDSRVQDRIDEYSNSGSALPDGGAVVNVTPGNYYLNSSNQPDYNGPTGPDKVRFLTESGRVNIAIKEGTSSRLLFGDVEVEVVGTNPVTVYSGNGDSLLTSFPKIRFRNATMDTRDGRTDLFRILVNSTGPLARTNVTLSDDTEFHGTLYAPDTEEVQVGNSEVHGGMVVGEADLVDSGIHYDQRLRDPRADGISAINYLHVTDNRIRVK